MYLLQWAHELSRARDVGMNGLGGFTYPMIADWARLTGREPNWMEVDALFAIDHAMRFPDEVSS